MLNDASGADAGTVDTNAPNDACVVLLGARDAAGVPKDVCDEDKEAVEIGVLKPKPLPKLAVLEGGVSCSVPAVPNVASVGAVIPVLPKGYP